MSGWVLLVVVSIPLIVLEIAAFGEVAFRRSDLRASRRVLWCVALFAVPYLSLLVYVVARPVHLARRGPPTGRSSEPTAEALVVAAERYARGELDEAGYDRAIASAFTGAAAGRRPAAE